MNVVSVLAPIGGIEAALVPLALEFDARGHEVSLYVLDPPSRPNQNIDPLEAAGIAILTPSAPALRLARLGRKHGSRIAGHASALAVVAASPLLAGLALRRRHPVGAALRDARSRLWGAIAQRLACEGLPYGRLRRELRRRPPDVVHVHGWGCGDDPPGAMSHLHRLGVPLVYTESGSPDPRDRPSVPDAPMSLADVVIAISEAGQDALRTVAGARTPVRRIPYCVDPLPTAPRVARRGDFVVTCVARLSREKRHLDLLEAFARVQAAVPGARLLLAGVGPLEDELRTRTRQLAIESSVEFLGLVTRAGLPELLASTDVVALTSAREGLPVALIEALAGGKPIVATDTGGIPELVRHGENGLLVPVGDIEALAAALLELVSDPTRRQHLGTASAALFAQGGFSRAAAADSHLEVYGLAIASHGGRP